MADVIKTTIQPTWEAVDSYLKKVHNDFKYSSAYFSHPSVHPSVHPSFRLSICPLSAIHMPPIETYRDVPKQSKTLVTGFQQS